VSDSWPHVTLDKVCERITDGTHHSPTNLPSGDFRYVTAKNIRPWGLDLSDISYVDRKTHREIYSRCPVERGDVLYIKDGVTTGLAVVNPLEEQFSMLSSVALLKPRREVLESSYLKHWLNSPLTVAKMTSEMTGTAIKRLVLRQIRAARIPLPSIGQQRLIADKLNALLAKIDACRGRLERVPQILKKFREAVLDAAVSGKLTEEWRTRNGTDLEPWSTTSVGQLVTKIEGGLNVQCEERPPEPGEKGLVKISAVTWGEFDEEESKTLPRGRSVSEAVRILAGDLLISRANTLELVGACEIVQSVSRRVYLSDKVLRLRTEDQLKPWLLISLRSRSGRNQIETLASGNQLSMRNLSQANLRLISIALPPHQEMAEAVRRVDVLFALADSLQRRYDGTVRQVEALTPSVLMKAFRGELVSQDPNDEPAGEMLERIGLAPEARRSRPGNASGAQRKQMKRTEQKRRA
jgi:type I restriction enzyme S subunit